VYLSHSPGRRSRSLVLVALLASAWGGGEILSNDTDNDGLSDDEEDLVGTSPFNPDTDGDGLLDGWEVHGLQRLGTLEPLPLEGADPLQKDVFVEIDWMTASGTDSQRNAVIAYQAAADVTRVFARSGTGIRIHFDLGPNILNLLPEGAVEDDFDVSAFADTPDSLKVLPLSDRFPARPATLGDSTTINLHDLYYGGDFFLPSRRNIFYYVVFADQAMPESVDPTPDEQRLHPYSERFDDEPARAAGLRDTGVQVTVIFRKPSPLLSPALERFRYSSYLLHELGHAFGLGHGGAHGGFRWDNTNYKPNYPSVMNYRYQFCGLDTIDGLPVMDFSHGRMGVPLFERALVEQIGVGPLPNETILRCLGVAHLEVPGFPGCLDWDGDGKVADAPVMVDLNFNGVLDTEPMKDHDD
jgi:hypothetical protein